MKLREVDDARRDPGLARRAGEPGRAKERKDTPMSMTDPIADLLTRIRNGQTAGKTDVQMPVLEAKTAIAKVLKDEGYIADSVTAENDDGKPTLTIELKYYEGSRSSSASSASAARACASTAARTSCRRSGRMGIVIVSTSQGRDDRRAGARERAGRRSAVHRA